MTEPTAIQPAQPLAPLDVMRQQIASTSNQVDALAEAGQLDLLAAGLAGLRKLHADLGILRDAVEAHVANLMPQPQWDVEGVGRLERRTGVDRRSWQWDALWPVLVRLELDPDGTGELPSAAETVDRLAGLARDVIGLTPSKQPRVTEIRGRGLDPDDWCDVKPGRVSVQITEGAA